MTVSQSNWLLFRAFHTPYPPVHDLACNKVACDVYCSAAHVKDPVDTDDEGDTAGRNAHAVQYQSQKHLIRVPPHTPATGIPWLPPGKAPYRSCLLLLRKKIDEILFDMADKSPLILKDPNHLFALLNMLLLPRISSFLSGSNTITTGILLLIRF